LSDKAGVGPAPDCDAASASAGDLIVVPARFGSSRLPGKPLALIAGRTLLERVAAVACAAAAQLGACKVLVATDDDRIAEHASALGVSVAMTSSELASGTDRAFLAAQQLETKPVRVINLQGDAPFIPASIVTGVMQALRDGAADVATPVVQLDWSQLDGLRAHKQITPFSGTTCIRAANGRALWFSKAVIPAIRNEDRLRQQPFSPVWQHLGLYGYGMAALEWFAGAPPSTYEVLEGLEQLRFLEGGWTIDTIPVEIQAHWLSGIDTPEDLAMAEDMIARFGDPFPA
jgi:3-deoxy-manno-octulosonate cytidylyltransferase (CMP-KDO synthetase)